MVEPESAEACGLTESERAALNPEAGLDTEVAPAPPLYSRGALSAGLALVFLGVGLLMALAVAEVLWLQGVPWANALMVLDSGAPPEGALAVRHRSIPPADQEFVAELEKYLQQEAALQAELERVIDSELLDGETSDDTSADLAPPQPFALPYAYREHVIMLELAPEAWPDLLQSGRAPEPGQPEVVAGDMADQIHITLDGVEFEVVGRMRRGMSATNMAYFLPDAPQWETIFAEGNTATRGWLHPEGILHAQELLAEESLSENAQVVGGSRTHLVLVLLSVLALALMAVGGCMAHMQFFWWLSGKETGLAKPLFTAMAAWPRTLYWCHAVYFGLFFVAMYQGITNPVWCTRIGETIAQLFADGDLSYIGDAYSSGNYLAAAAATWWNNYMLQTLVLTFAISIPPLGLGLLKTAFSFIQTGFVMPPVQVGSAGGYSYHGITMVLELEAYIVACFAVVLWMVHFYRALTTSSPLHEFAQGLRIMLAAAVVCAVMLAVAGLYEAVTLITFAMF